MKSNNKKIIWYTLIAILVGFAIYLFAFYQSVTDTKNVLVEGYVYDTNTNQPLAGVNVKISSERYESDNGIRNYDEYLGHDVIELATDESGFYSTVIPKSAFLWIDFKKEGYNDGNEKGQYVSKKMKYKTSLKRK